MNLERLLKIYLLCLCFSVPLSAEEASVSGEQLYNIHCAFCHSGSVSRAPRPASLGQLTKTNLLSIMNEGVMKSIGDRLQDEEKQAIADYLLSYGDNYVKPTMPQSAFCQPDKTSTIKSQANWNGWGNGLSNQRLQSANAAGLNANTVPKLKLKWAFSQSSSPSVGF